MTHLFDRLLHVGAVVVDLVATVAQLPERGGDVLASGMRSTPGGGFNVMVAAARQGLAVAYGGAHGTGPFGDVVRAALCDAGIAVLHAPRPGADTGLVVCLVDDDGERTFVTGPDAALAPDPAELAALRPDGRDIVHVSGYGLVRPADAAALLPWLHGLPDDALVTLDPGPLAPSAAPEALAEALRRADWCRANAREAAEITGATDPVRAAAALGGRSGAVVRTGRQGCVVRVSDAAPVVVAGFAVHAVDTTGAGDAHTGVLLARLARGTDPVEAARTANAAAALAVTRRGPATSPTAGELAGFLRTATAG